MQKYLEEIEIIPTQLACVLQENEFDRSGNLAEPLPVIVETLQRYKEYEEMVLNFPDMEIT